MTTKYQKQKNYLIVENLFFCMLHIVFMIVLKPVVHLEKDKKDCSFDNE